MNSHVAAITVAITAALTSDAFAGQGAGRMLYTVPNSTFVENPSGDNAVTIDDSSGSISTVQTLINNARNANPNDIIVIRLTTGATYWVNNSNAGLVLSSQECLIGSGALIEATNSAVTNSLITISAGSTNVSISGGALDANGANIYGIYAPSSSARINIDKVTVRNCGQDCIQLNGEGDGTFDNEMTVTRCDASGSPGHAGISIWNATQATCLDNNCHSNSAGIWMGNCGYCNIANNTCESNTTGIDFNSGNDNYIANNTCNNNGTGILLNGSSTMVVSDAIGSNTVAGINSSGSGNIYVDNLFTGGNGTNFMNNGSGDDFVAYGGAVNASGQNYFYPPLINNQHTNAIVNGMGRYDLTNDQNTVIDTVQSQYNAAVSANPGDVIVLHLNGNYTVGASPLALGSYTCVLLGGEIQINSSTTASCAIASTNQSYFSISGGVVDGGSTSPPSTGRNGIRITGDSMFQIDSMTLRNFGNNSERVGGADVIQIDHGNTPRIITRCTINGGSARGLWLQTSGDRDVVSDNTVVDVQMDGVDCDSSTSASLIKFNTLTNNARDGVFLEQSASDNCVLGNICNFDQRNGVECYNNSTTPRGSTSQNSIICNTILGDNGLGTGSIGTNVVTSSDNFFFDNTLMNSTISSQLYGTQNYFSQNYLGNSSLSSSSATVFFNSPDVSGYLNVQDNNSKLFAFVTNASTADGAAVILGPTNLSGGDQWSLIPTDSGYYRVMDKNSGLAMVVLGASTSNGAPIIQWTYNASGNDEWMPVSAGNGLYSFINRLSGLYLDVPMGNTSPGTQLDQQSTTGAANQQFSLIDAAQPAAAPSNGTWNLNGSGDWNTSSAWLDGIIASGTNSTATFPQGPDGLADNTALTVTINSSGLTIGALEFGGTAWLTNTYTIASSSGDTLTMAASGGTPYIDVPFSLAVGGTTESATISAVLAGSQGLAKTGGGFLVLSGANTITGGFTVTGSLRDNTTTSAFNNQSIVETGSASGDSIYFNVAGICGSACSIINYGPPESDSDASHLGAIRFATSGVNVTGTVTLLGSAGITARSATGGSFNSGQITDDGNGYALRFGRTSTSSSAGSGILVLSNITVNANSWGGNTTNSDGTLKLGASGQIPSGSAAGNFIMTTPGVEYQAAISPTVFDLNGFNQTINGLSSDPEVLSDDLTLLVITNSSTSAATLTVGNNNANGSYTGLIKSGNKLALSKIGTGTETLSGANTYNGNTTIAGGSLALSGNGSIANTPSITVAGGATFDVSGLSSAFTLGSSQVLSNSTSTATIAGNFNTGSGTLSLTYAAGTPSLSVSSGTLTLSSGAALTIKNTGAPLSLGTYTIIAAGGGTVGGTLPSSYAVTGAGLTTGASSSLEINGGALELIVTLPAPHITGIRVNGTTLMMTATNGAAGGHFVLLGSTNLAMPLQQWTPILTNEFDGSGDLNLMTNIISPANPLEFYILSQ
ncbi:MAG TPA: RICIN domain-containing protein [Alphaproteobacteria bacterium]|nr:RICIN domain-containing protein [Alphaproteobacteria bacterium]